MLTEEPLEFGVEPDVGLDVGEQIDHDPAVERGIHQWPGEVPEVRADKRGEAAGEPSEELAPQPGFGNLLGHPLPAPRGWVDSAGLQGVVLRAERVLVGVAVLNDQGGDLFGQPHRQSEADLGAVVVQVDCEARQSHRLNETLQEGRAASEDVVDRLRDRVDAEAEARKVGGDQASPISEGGHEVAVPDRGRGVAVRGQDDRCVRRTGLPLEDLHIINGYYGIEDNKYRSASSMRFPN